MRNLLLIFTLLVSANIHAQTLNITNEVLIDDDFESGSTDWVNWVRPDYSDVPSVVSSDAGFPAAFPLPAGQGTFVIRNADDDNDLFGLAGLHPDGTLATPSDPVYVNLFSNQVTSVTVSGDVYIDTAGGGSNERNIAFCAIQDDDVPSSPTSTIASGEAYYRFGVRADFGGAYLQLFSAASGTQEFTPPARDTTIPINDPGWNNFRIEFDASDNVNCFINGVACSWNGTVNNDNAIQYVTVGGLAFNLTSFNPILMDNAYLAQELTVSSPASNWLSYE
jgi:hypothetical protein